MGRRIRFVGRTGNYPDVLLDSSLVCVSLTPSHDSRGPTVELEEHPDVSLVYHYKIWLIPVIVSGFRLKTNGANYSDAVRSSSA